MPAGQLTYSIFNVIAQPGQLADLALNRIVSFPAAETINPGVAVELAADGVSVQQVQGTTASANNSYAAGGLAGASVLSGILGISVLKTVREGAGAVGLTAYGVGGPFYAIGDMVPVLMAGRIFASWLPNGVNVQPPFASGTYNASSTGYLQVYHGVTVGNRGMFTTAQANGTTTYSPAGANVRSRYSLPFAGQVLLLDIAVPGAI